MFTATGFYHGGPLDPPRGATLLSLGDISTPPSYDAPRSVVANAKFQVSVQESEEKGVDVPAGSYWVWSSNTVTITVSPCSPASLTNVQPVP